MSPLADKLQLVYVDHRGQGRSGRGPRESYTLDNNVEDLEALRDYLGLGKVVLLGASYGGIVALSYAVRYPENVSHLIAVVTAPHAGFLQRAKEILAERGNEEQLAAAKTLWAGAFRDEADLRHYYRAMRSMYALKQDPAAAEEAEARGILSVDAINEGFGGFLRSYDVSDQLQRITAPTLVIGAAHDWICAPEFSREIAEKIPNADLRIFEHSSHSVITDEHQAFIDVVRGFVTYNG